jgi:hypothetical protein
MARLEVPNRRQAPAPISVVAPDLRRGARL